ncbi:hypothetical protein JMJ94_14410 [Rhodovulum visakhapatnamense]|nr:hypothetical protein [Rhodovulum visakhapatnamense]
MQIACSLFPVHPTPEATMSPAAAAVLILTSYDNELISETYAVQTVIEVLEDLNDQGELF